MLAAQSFSARIDGDQLRIALPRLHFIGGEALNRLRDGVTVKYQVELSALDPNNRVLARSEQQFAISYDLWEEKFAVSNLGPSSRSISHLSADRAEAWCVDNISVPVAAVSGNPTFWMRLDYRVVDATPSAETADNSGFTLSGLIDIFSRRARKEQLRGSEQIGPFRLESLKKQ